MRKAYVLIVGLVLGSLLMGAGAANRPGCKLLNLDLYDTSLDVGTREQFWQIEAYGPSDSDGTPAVGATQWLEFALDDYVSAAWVQVYPDTSGSAQSNAYWTVPPGGKETIDLHGKRARRIRYRSGSAPSDSLGALIKWGVQP